MLRCLIHMNPYMGFNQPPFPNHVAHHISTIYEQLQPRKIVALVQTTRQLSRKYNISHLSREAAFGADENSPLLRDAEATAASSPTFPLVERRTRPAALFVPPPVGVAVEARGRLREGGLAVTPFFDWSKYCKLPSLSSASCARVDLGGVELRGETPRR